MSKKRQASSPTLTLSAKSLAHAIKQVSPIASGKRKPILGFIHASHTDGQLTLSATDLEQSLSVVLDGVDGTEAVSFLLPVSPLLAILADWRGDDVRLGIGDGVTLENDSSSFSILTPDVGEFPSIAGDEGKPIADVACDVLCSLISRGVYATDAASSRFALASMLWDIAHEEIISVATDGRRLVMQRAAGVVHSATSILVPAFACKTVCKLLGTCDGDVRIHASNNRVTIVHESFRFASLLTEGRFPDYRKTIPDESDEDSRAHITVGHWASAIRQCLAVSDETTHGVTHSLATEELSVQCACATKGRSRVTIPCSYAANQPARDVVLDGRFVSQFLATVSPESTVDVRLTSGPVVMECDGVTTLIMPMER